MNSGIGNISELTIKRCEHRSKYIKQLVMQYVQNGKQKQWNLVEVKDCVTVIIFNRPRNRLVFVKQFRPAVYYSSVPENERKIGEPIDTKKYPPELGVTIEFCAGIVDKPNKSLKELAKEEIFEETGYNACDCELEKICTFRSGSGVNTAVQTNFYCEVTDDMKRKDWKCDENIELVEMSVAEVKDYMRQSFINSPPGFMSGVYWFLSNKC